MQFAARFFVENCACSEVKDNEGMLMESSRRGLGLGTGETELDGGGERAVAEMMGSTDGGAGVEERIKSEE